MGKSYRNNPYDDDVQRAKKKFIKIKKARQAKVASFEDVEDKKKDFETERDSLPYHDRYER